MCVRSCVCAAENTNVMRKNREREKKKIRSSEGDLCVSFERKGETTRSEQKENKKSKQLSASQSIQEKTKQKTKEGANRGWADGGAYVVFVVEQPQCDQHHQYDLGLEHKHHFSWICSFALHWIELDCGTGMKERQKRNEGIRILRSEKNGAETEKKKTKCVLFFVVGWCDNNLLV